MLTSKSFVKKTKKGNVLKVVREHYLRDDIWCGSKLCAKCKHEDPSLSSAPKSSSDLFPSPHYVVPDTNVVLHQIDVLKEDVFKNVIILQTVQQELRHRHSPGYNAIREILANKDRHFYVFTNEHHKETYIEREAGESANDRNDRAIRTSVNWYCKHLANRVDIVLLTNDEENRCKAQEQGLKACTLAAYVRSLRDHPGLLDKLAKLELDASAKEADNRRGVYPEHLPQSELHLGIKSGRFEQGKFQASRDNYLEGSVVLGDDEESRSVLIQGRSNLNRAVHEDQVVVEIFPEDKWSLPSGLVLVDETQDDEDKTDEEEEVKLNPMPAKSKRVPTGRIVGILRRKWRPYCGILAPSSIKEATRHLFVPAERRIPKIRIETRQAETLCRQRIVVSIDSWPKDSRYPLGHLVRALGDIGDRATENQVLLLEHDIPHQCFSRAVLDCLPSTPWVIGPREEQGRKDLRHLCICSVDPPGCTDIDDALHCRELPNHNFEVGVHIADVSYFVRPGTALDQEAANRGTTVYLVDQRIDMVPELLSSDLCSLRGGEERLAFSAVWEMTPEGEVLSTVFHKSIIKSRAALTYAEAQARIDDKSKNDDLTLGLRGLNTLAKVLKAKRIANGALTLASTEVRFHVDSETHDPIDVQTKQVLETNSMVEEFMLLANASVAKHIFQEFPECALLRRHPSPAPANLEPLVKAGLSKGFDIKVDSGLHLAESLDKATMPEQPYFNVMLRMVATRCMARALYFSSGCVALEDFFHYGLALPYYTHFTSPIRRYADLMVHRLLAVCTGAEGTYPELVHKEKCQELCNNLNYRHNMAQYAGRASVALYTQAFFQEKVVDEEGYVLFVRENALKVLLPRFGLEATVFLKEEGWTYDEEAGTQSFGGVTFHQFDRLTVQVSVDSRNVQHQKIVVKIVEPKVVMSFIPELTETWTSVSIAGNESYLHNLSLLLEPGHPVVRVRARGPFIADELGNLSGVWTVFTLLGSDEEPVRVPTAPSPLQPPQMQWEHLFPLRRDSIVEQPLGGYALEVHLESSSSGVSQEHQQVSLSLDVSAFTELTQLGLLMGGAVLLGLYVLIVFELVHRTLAAMLAATAAIACLALIGDRPSLAKVMSWLDVETLSLLFGMMVLVAILCETGFFDYAAVVAFRVARGRVWPLVTTLCATTALVSAFLDNVTTILLMTPATIKLCEVMDLDPKLILIWLVIFSNIGGAATPVGDPPNVIIISNTQVAAMGINFTSFTAHMAPGALLCLVGAYLLLRLRDPKSLRPHEPPELLELQRELDIWRKAFRSLSEYSRDEKHVKDILERKVKRLERMRSRKVAELRCTEEGFRQNLQLLSDKYKIRNRSLLVKTGIVLGCVIVLFFMQSFPNLHLSLGWIAVLGALMLLVLADLDDLESVMARVEWSTLVFFAALFVVMEALGELQLIYFIGQRTQDWIGALRPQSQLPVAILIVTWVSALASSLMDNIPFTTAMVKVVTGLGTAADGPALVYALAWGACLGGNGTLIGASANVVCAGVAEQHGHRFTFFDFFKIGFPVMLLTTAIASLWLLFCHVWLQWNT